jgi:hypothetical protein
VAGHVADEVGRKDQGSLQYGHHYGLATVEIGSNLGTQLARPHGKPFCAYKRSCEPVLALWSIGIQDKQSCGVCTIGNHESGSGHFHHAGIRLASIEVTHLTQS